METTNRSERDGVVECHRRDRNRTPNTPFSFGRKTLRFGIVWKFGGAEVDPFQEMPLQERHICVKVVVVLRAPNMTMIATIVPRNKFPFSDYE